MSSALRLLYVTAPNNEEAHAIAQALIEKRLIACANIFPQVQSVYRWNEKIQIDSEVVVTLKTEEELVQTVIDMICELHSYDVPCVISLPIEHGSRAYLDWIKKECQTESR